MTKSQKARKAESQKAGKPEPGVVDLQAAAEMDEAAARLAFERADAWARSTDGAAYGEVKGA